MHFRKITANTISLLACLLIGFLSGRGWNGEVGLLSHGTDVESKEDARKASENSAVTRLTNNTSKISSNANLSKSILKIPRIGYKSKKALIELLDGIDSGKESSFLDSISELLEEGRFSNSELETICSWISEKNPSEALKWVAGLGSESAAKITPYLYSAITASNPENLSLVLGSAAFEKNPQFPDVYAGILQSSPTKAATLFKSIESDKKDKLRLVKIAKMQNLRIKSALREGGMEGAKALLATSTGTTEIKFDDQGKPAGHKGGSNANLITEFFQEIKTLKKQPVEDLINTLKQSSWFGSDVMDTTAALTQLVEIDGRRAVENALALQAASQGSVDYATSVFADWANKDEKGALEFLNSAKLPQNEQIMLVHSLYQITSDPEIKEETKQIMLENNWSLPPDNPVPSTLKK